MGALIKAFRAPILVILVINLVIFIWVITVVIRHAREKAIRTDKVMNKNQILRMTISISGVVFLFGLMQLALFYSHVLCFWTPRNLSNSLCRLQLAPGVPCVCFYLIRFDYWKALLSCEKHKSKHIRPSLGTNISSKKQSTNLSTLSKQEKITFETSHILTTDQEIDTETLVTKKDLEALQISGAMASPTDLANTEDSSIVHKINDLVYQNDQNANGIESQKGEFKKQTKPCLITVWKF